jgi:Fe-Mn family superoxide dismutase
MTIELPDLPYAYDALEPVISSTTLKTHHAKHHRAYVDKTNALVRDTDLAGATLDAIVRESGRLAANDPAKTTLFNNAAQAWNHAFYWSSLRPKGGGGPQGALAARINTDFGDQRSFAEALKTAATGHFGSGWAWLVVDGGKLRIVTTSNAETPIVRGQAPLLVIDVWEHAYYLDHQERRAAYVAGVVESLLNWEFVERKFERASGGLGDVIYVSGHRLDTADIEWALVAHPAVAEAAVVGNPHPVKGQGVYACVVLRPGTRPSDDLRRELRQWVRREIGPIAVPDVIQWTPSLPKNRVGQLMRHILRRIVANDGSDLGDTSMLADTRVIDDLINGRPNMATTAE